MGMKDNLGTCFYTHPTDTMKIFDTCVKPILLYGSDFWGCLPLPRNNPIENIHLMFCKHLLGVQRNTTTDGVLLELGRIPLSLYANTAAIKNWERIRMGKCNPLVLASTNNAEHELLLWVQRIKLILSENGMGYIHIENNEVNAHKKVFARQADIRNQTSLSNISKPDSKLKTYSLIKKDLGTENYLIDVINTKHRVALSKFRPSNHELMIEVGRHKRVPKEERLCPLCPNPVVEDEIHFLVNCQSLNDIRKNTLCDNSMAVLTLPFYTDTDKFTAIMNGPSISLAKFIFKAMEFRRNILSQKGSQEDMNLNQNSLS